MNLSSILSSILVILLSLCAAVSASAAVPANVRLTVISPPAGTSGQTGKPVQAEAVITRVATNEQLKPLALAVLEHLKVSHPGAPSYSVSLSDDARMMKVGNVLAVAAFREGKTAVTGGIPMAMDIRVMRASHVPVRKPDELGLQVTYEVALLARKAAGKGGGKVADREYARIAKKRKMTVAQVKQVAREITQYYKAFEGQPLQTDMTDGFRRP